MKFSFINPSPSPEVLDMCTASWPPLGVLYCASVLMDGGVEVSILDQASKGLSSKQTLDWVKKEDPDILGYSALYQVPEDIRRIKEENPKVIIVLGNYHATFNAERILQKHPYIDIIVRGEGEYTCLELAKCLEKGGSLKKIKGITFRNNKGKILSTPDRQLIMDLDSLPFPDRDLIDSQYTSTILGLNVATKKFTSVLSSRGCLFNCRFCGCRRFARGTWRPRTVDNIIKEIELLQSKGYKQLLFVDDTFTLNPKRVIRLCNEMRREKMDVEWFCDSRVDKSGYQMFREMVAAGCRSLYFGIESANQRILDYYRKGTNPSLSKNAVRKARNAGIDVIVGSFIVGAPDETKQEILNTLKFVHKLEIDVPSLNILRAFPGTDLWDDLVVKGYIDEDQSWERGVYVSKVSPHTLPFEEICLMINEHFRAFYLHPKHLMKEIFRTLKSPFRIGAVFNNLTRLNQIAETVKRGVVLNY